LVEAIPLRIGPGPDGEPAAYIDDIGVRTKTPEGREALRFVPGIHGPRLVDYVLKRAGRRGDGQWERIGWDQAMDEIAAKQRNIREREGPEELATLGGSKLANFVGDQPLRGVRCRIRREEETSVPTA
jgi:Molybdopterin oxidoreductase